MKKTFFYEELPIHPELLEMLRSIRDRSLDKNGDIDYARAFGRLVATIDFFCEREASMVEMIQRQNKSDKFLQN